MYIWRLLIVLLCLPGFATEVSSQDIRKGGVTGQLVDAVTLEPLIGANVIVEGYAGIGTATDSDGLYRLEQVEAGIYSLRFSYLGYQSFIATDVVIRSN
ncbi:MAG: carboxypeptidase-like regulatory domain-containing protein [Cyclonatronaceae bacterium]